ADSGEEEEATHHLPCRLGRPPIGREDGGPSPRGRPRPRVIRPVFGPDHVEGVSLFRCLRAIHFSASPCRGTKCRMMRRTFSGPTNRTHAESQRSTTVSTRIGRRIWFLRVSSRDHRQNETVQQPPRLDVWPSL